MAQERDSNEKSPWPTGSRWQTSSNWRTKHLETSKPQEQTETHSRWPAPPTVNRWPQFENSSNSGSNPPTKPRVSSTYPRPVDPDGDKAIALAFTEGRRIYVGNLPYMAKREDVEDLFAEGDGTHPEGHYKMWVGVR